MKKLRSQTRLRDYLSKNPGVLHDSTVTHFDIPWSSDAPSADPKLITNVAPDLIENADPRSPAQSPRSPRGRASVCRLSRAASRTHASDNYIET